MTSAAEPLAIAETDQIAALLAEVTGRVAPKPKTAPSIPAAPDVATTIKIQKPARQLLEQGNWRNESPEAPEARPEKNLAPKSRKPLPAPFGVLTVGALFALVNWRNRTDEVQPLPTIKPPPPPGAEFTVETFMSTFGWE